MDLLGTLTRTGTTGTVELRRRYSTSPDDLWSALTEPVRLARWMAPVRGDLREGGSYEVVFDEADDGQRAWGDIERCERPSRLEVTWEFPGEAGVGRVVVTLVPVGAGTELTLVHSGLEHGPDVGYAAGWEVYLRHLEADVEGRDAGDWWSQWESLRDEYAKQVAA